MKKKIFIFFFLVVLLSVLAYLKFYGRNSGSISSHISNMVFNNNTIRLDCVGFSSEKVDITWRSDEQEKVIIQSGRQIAKIGNDYGPNRFDVRIDGKKIVRLGNWKTANWATHDYLIFMEKEPAGYHVKFCADGPDYEKDDEHIDTNGKLTGAYCSWYANGNKSVEGVYKNGEQEGEFKYYFIDGTIRVKENFRDGKLSGHCISYRPDGSVESDILY